MTNRRLQPDLMNEWGTRFYGKAKHAGDVWWYEEPLSNGTIKLHPLIPVSPLVCDGEDGKDTGERK